VISSAGRPEKYKSSFVFFRVFVGLNWFSFIIKQNNFYKFVVWYDNEIGYSKRLVELAQYIS